MTNHLFAVLSEAAPAGGEDAKNEGAAPRSQEALIGQIQLISCIKQIKKEKQSCRRP